MLHNKRAAQIETNSNEKLYAELIKYLAGGAGGAGALDSQSLPIILNELKQSTSSGRVIVEFDLEKIRQNPSLDTILRDGDEIKLDFILGELPVNNESFVPAKSQTSSDPIGLKVADVDRDNPNMSNLPDGVIVSRVNPGSPASGKVTRGDLITMIQYKGKKFEIDNVESFEEALENFSSGNKVAFHIIRNGSRLIRSITIN